MGRKRINPIKQPRFKFNIDDTVIYIGCLYDQYKNTECTIIDRIKSKQKEYYKVKFHDGNIYLITVNVLKRKDNEDADQNK
jgi:hypothetical protein